MLQVLPGAPEQVKGKLEKLEAELAQLEQQHGEIRRKAQRFPNAMLYGGETL
jgi:hypothetical protein